ncbi:MAG: hypothetical protein M1817_003752 [Caeruleum heppii]|nr:MAG: hypothetical protein M1817_003752 [Caeruleum heppii]
MSATVGDLLSPTPSPSIAGPEFYDFDLAAVGLGFHHFEDPDLAARRLVQRLKPGTGVLLITDFLPYAPTGASTHAHHHEGHGDDPGTKGVEHTVAHHGFARERIEHMFQKAGCVDDGPNGLQV